MGEHHLLQPLDGQAAALHRAGALEHRSQLRRAGAAGSAAASRADTGSARTRCGSSGSRPSRSTPPARRTAGASRRRDPRWRRSSTRACGNSCSHSRVNWSSMWFGHHHDRLADHPKAAQLARADDHLRGLAGADLVKQADRRLGQHPRDGGALMRHRRERPDQPRERQPLAVGGVVAQHDRVEPAVVLAEQPLGRGRGPPSTTARTAPASPAPSPGRRRSRPRSRRGGRRRARR